MSETSWQLIGKIKEAHGLKGELYVLVFAKDTSWAKQLKVMQISGKTYNVIRAKAHRDGLIVACEGVTDRNASEALRSLEVSIPSDLLVSRKGETIYLKEILGFMVINNDVEIAAIESFSSNGPQDLLVVSYQKMRVEIPFVEAFIQRIDFEKKEVHMDFPEGLLELGSPE